MTLLLTCTHKHTPYSHLSSFSPHIFIHLCIPPVIIRPASFPPTLNSLLPPSLGINPSTFIYLPPLLPLFLLHPHPPPLLSGVESCSSLAAEKSLELSITASKIIKEGLSGMLLYTLSRTSISAHAPTSA